MSFEFWTIRSKVPSWWFYKGQDFRNVFYLFGKSLLETRVATAAGGKSASAKADLSKTEWFCFIDRLELSWGRLYRCCLLSHRSPVWDSQQFGDRRFEMVVLTSLCTSSWKIQLSEVKLHSFTTCRQELIMDSYGSDRINLFWWNVSRLQPGRRNPMLGWGSTCRLRSHMSCTMPFSPVKSLCSGSYPALYSRHGDSTELTVA